MATPTDWHAEYQRLLKRVRYLNGIMGTLGGLADHWTGEPGSISCTDAGEVLLACLEPGQTPAASDAPARPRLTVIDGGGDRSATAEEA